MSTQQVLESELTARGIQCVAVASLELEGLKYGWLSIYPRGLQEQIQQRCQAVRGEGRAVLLVTHQDGNVSLWQAAPGTAAPVTPDEAPPTKAATQDAEPAVTSPDEPQAPETITIRYRGGTATKTVGPGTPDTSRSGQQRSYRGRKY